VDKLDFGYYNMDCMAGMKLFPDKYFDVAIVDPPYGINAPNMAMGTNKSRTKNGYPSESTASRLKRSGQVKEWDSKPPTEEYFKELFRVSKNQIIWGGNYFNLPPTKCFVVWDKVQPWDAFSQAEIAWTSYNLPAKLFRYSNTGGTNSEKRIHPTQKPIALYEYLVGAFKLSGGGWCLTPM
jgi:site-specific DNA-methyltransferase (adenine-specific)